MAAGSTLASPTETNRQRCWPRSSGRGHRCARTRRISKIQSVFARAYVCIRKICAGGKPGVETNRGIPMEAGVEVDAGICGFRTCARAISEDGQHVVIELGSECEKVRNLGKVLKHMDPLDAYTEISP